MSRPHTGFAPLTPSRTASAMAAGPSAVGFYPGQISTPGQIGLPGQADYGPPDPALFVNDFTRPLPEPAVTFSGPGYLSKPAPSCGFSTAALILALIGVVTVIPAVLAIAFGHIGVYRTRNNQRLGRGMAMGGMILGYAVSLFWAVLLTTTWIAGW